ncbi:MAG: hypothetical protein JJE51_02075 [Thermoanaerobaculia bacterium]|nr:hypothetical protein [Thermoanaerobaculia bacterium]
MKPANDRAGVVVVRDARGARLMREGVDLTEPFAEIESFDVSLDRREVAFSAKRERGYDIGLVHLDGSPISWVPEDPADEVQVHWAPRGNKISYFVRSPGGDLVRTVHVPTATALTIDFPFSVLRTLEWDAAAERFTVTADSPDSSARTEVMKYGGEERRVTATPAAKLDVEIVPLAGNALLLQPQSIAYDERLPLVIWISDGPRNGWSDARGELMQRVRAATIVTDRAPDETLWTAIGQLPWAERTRTYVVDASGHSVPREGALTIRGDSTVRPGRFRRGTNSIAVQPAVVESFSAGFIADELKGTSPRGH